MKSTSYQANFVYQQLINHINYTLCELSLFANNGASFNDLVMARLLHKYKLPPCWYRERPLREIQASIESRCCQGNFWRS
ncbi:hypothetical protein SB4536_110016 [Klebsiella pneumoniae subsp. pneumoniae T69]|nr:hypothetical protein SB4536_110016 [Klebsiella pneumoniae subsp. pneumoniae T69]